MDGNGVRDASPLQSEKISDSSYGTYFVMLHFKSCGVREAVADEVYGRENEDTDSKEDGTGYG